MAGYRGIEPRCSVLEAKLFPEGSPRSGDLGENRTHGCSFADCHLSHSVTRSKLVDTEGFEPSFPRS